MIEAGSVASAVIGGFLTGVPPGDLKLILSSKLTSFSFLLQSLNTVKVSAVFF